MAFPQVLASQTPTVKVLSPKYLQQYERSGRTADPGMRRCGMAVSGMRGCGALQEMQCLPRRRNFGRSLEEAFLLLETVRGVRSTKTDTWKIGFPDQARRNAPSNLPAGAGMDPLSAGQVFAMTKSRRASKLEDPGERFRSCRECGESFCSKSAKLEEPVPDHPFHFPASNF